MTLVLSVIILTTCQQEGRVLGGQAGQESFKSCDNYRALLGVTGRPRNRALVSPRVKRRSVATGSSAKVPRAAVLNESTSPGEFIPATAT